MIYLIFLVPTFSCILEAYPCFELPPYKYSLRYLNHGTESVTFVSLITV